MKSQIYGLANLINPEFENFDVKLKSLFKNLPIELIPSINFAYENLDKIHISQKTIIISCGKKSIKASLILKKKFKPLIFNIHIQNPKTQFNSFDLIICPEHDNLNKHNSISTLLALHNIEFTKNIRKKGEINFILGGPNKYFKFDNFTQQNICDEIIILSKNNFINIIPSRRTPNHFIKRLKNLDIKNTSLIEDQFNPIEYGNLLSASDAHIVTWDSISMISEAISSGAKTLIFPFEEKNCPQRYKEFYKKIFNQGLAQNYNRDLKAPIADLTKYNLDLRSMILNKIESHLWFKSDAS